VKIGVIAGLCALVGLISMVSAGAVVKSASRSTATHNSVPLAGATSSGDIPDTTKYSPHSFPQGGFVISLPDGWSSSTTASSVHFSSAVNTVDVSWRTNSAKQSTAMVVARDVATLKHSITHFHLVSTMAVNLSGGPAVRVDYQTTSRPDPVTGRQYRLVVKRFIFVRSHQLLFVNLSSPVGADNVDPWRIISQSVRFSK
jgi:hypothetical protein